MNIQIKIHFELLFKIFHTHKNVIIISGFDDRKMLNV